MVRMYIQLDELHGIERAADRKVTPEILLEKANAILSPYTLELREVAWCSAYEIGQRLCNAFDDVPESERETRSPRIFIAGDACHTHSPKAGQGMNVSMADTFNLGWKLASVIDGRSDPKLLHTYSSSDMPRRRNSLISTATWRNCSARAPAIGQCQKNSSGIFRNMVVTPQGLKPVTARH